MDYAVAITREPSSTARRDIDELREVGWTDAQILTATEVVGFFNYYVRMVEALGVEPEPEMERDAEVWPTPIVNADTGPSSSIIVHRPTKRGQES